MAKQKLVLASVLGSLLLPFSALCQAQTASCTNWTFFKASSSAVRTFANGINRWNVVTGDVPQSSQPFDKGFLRYSDGSIKTYVYPSSVWTAFSRRNSQGVTVGSYGDSSPNNLIHGFVLSGSKTATVNYPGALNTSLAGINYYGSIVGYYLDKSGNTHGFELKNSAFTRIDYPGSAFTQVESISDTGIIVGFYESKLSNGALGSPHGFVLAKGVYKTLDDPKGALHYGYGTRLFDINSSGVIVGSYHLNGNEHAFLYTGGKFKDVLPPNSTSSVNTGINGNGMLVGQGTLSGVTVGYTAHCQ